jgi:NAD(P)-dependent dehydrogenase (short-subunit alcohol dehydrogenase family)
MTQTAPRRWFITGASTGFGRLLALEAVRRGGLVVGTIRQPAQVAELEALGVKPVLLDVNDTKRTALAVEEGLKKLGGRLDILVNNAGFGLMGAIEALDEDAIRDVFETNFFGALRVTRALIPALRAQGGVIVSISSMAGRVGLAGAGAYCASKFALEGLSETLARELEPFGVKVLIVEPGAFRTDFSGRSIRTADVAVSAYAGMQAGEVKQLMAQYHGHEPGDPNKAIAAIFTALDAPEMPLRLVLGADAVSAIQASQDRMRAEMTAWDAASRATAFA